jgi:coenzyme F420-0:L-glutamate ligase/coenzyme F420-1:gamma-L-glutamate ligase
VTGVELRVRALEGIPEIARGDDLAGLILGTGVELQDGDIVVITSKIISKAEGRTRPAAEREQAIDDETLRVVATREHAEGTTRIVENRLGIVAAAAGVDASNTADGTILLLPLDPDASARAIAASLRRATGRRVGVIVTDTLGRPWRVGQTDVAIGAAGVIVVDDLRGTADTSGVTMSVTMPCLADEIAAASDLVKGKTGGRPIAVVSGLAHLVGDLTLPGASTIVRPAAEDMFSLGTQEARAEGRHEGYASGYQAGRAQGSAAGRRIGYAEGFAEGVTVHRSGHTARRTDHEATVQETPTA